MNKNTDMCAQTCEMAGKPKKNNRTYHAGVNDRLYAVAAKQGRIDFAIHNFPEKSLQVPDVNELVPRNKYEKKAEVLRS